MAYIKNTWIDQDVERPKTYEVTNNEDGSITLTDSFGLVTELGTPVNAVNMNHIEDGLVDTDVTKYNATTIYSAGEWVTGVVDNKKGIYASKINNNVGNVLSNEAYWEKVELGGGGYEINDLVWRLTPTEEAGKHLADGTLLQYGSYKQYIDKMADLYNSLLPTARTIYNVNIVGSLTNNNGVLSGFSTSNYAMTPLTVPTSSVNSWEFYTKVLFNSYPQTDATFIGDSSFNTGLAINLKSSGGIKLFLGNSGWNIASGIDSSSTVSLNTWYYIRVTFNGTAYKLDISTDNETWVNIISVSSSTKANLSKIVLGAWNTTSAASSIDLNSSYININGQHWWSGTSQIVACFTDEDSWQASVTQYGSCGKFVYDSVNNTVRLPKVSDILEGTTDITALGDLVEAGLPNLVGSFVVDNGDWLDGTLFSMLGQNKRGAIGDNGAQFGVDFRADRYNSIYGNSSTVQPQTIKALLYIVIATTTKTDIEVDIDEIATDLNGKADVDLTNCTDVANIKMAHNAMPSDKYIDLTMGASGTTYVAPADGWVYSAKVTGIQYYWFNLVNVTAGIYEGRIGATAGDVIYCLLPVSKGDIFRTDYSITGSVNAFKFIYANGAESEAQ